MKFRTVAAAAALIAANASAHAWFFFILPGAAMNAKPLPNEACVPASAQVGDKLRGPTGGIIRLESITGVVAMCNGTAGTPVLAKFTVVSTDSPAPSLTEAKTQAEADAAVGKLAADLGYKPPTPANIVCVPFGLGQGERTTVAGREVEIVRIIQSGGPCASRRPDAPWVAEYREVPQPAPVRVSAPAAKTVQDRLRELKQLRDENLITQENYESKQRDILSAQ